MVALALYWALVVGNGLSIVAAMLFGPRVRQVCRGAGVIIALALRVFVVPLVHLIVNTDPPPERWVAVTRLLIYSHR